MSNPLLVACKNRKSFIDYLPNNLGAIVIYLTATWCKPCGQISNHVAELMNRVSCNTIMCAKLDVDEYADLFTFLRSRKMVTGIPTILCYFKGTTSFVPDDSVSGADLPSINSFFSRVWEEAGNF